MSILQRVTDRLVEIYGASRAAQAAAEELNDAGLLASEPKSGMLENGDTFGDEDEGEEGGESVFDTEGDPEAIRASLVEMVDRWEPDGGQDRAMWLRARKALGVPVSDPTDCGEAGHAEGKCGNASCFVPWKCGKCGQRNSSWASKCGRCESSQSSGGADNG